MKKALRIALVFLFLVPTSSAFAYTFSISPATTTSNSNTVVISNTNGTNLFNWCYWLPNGNFGGDLGQITYPGLTDTWQNIFGVGQLGTYWGMLNYQPAYGACSSFGNRASAQASYNHYASAYWGFNDIVLIDLSGTSTQIIAQRAPADATTTTSTTVEFLWDYYNPGDTLENSFGASAIYLNDISHPATTTLFAGATIGTSSSIQTATADFVLRAGDTYQWYPILYNYNNQAVLTGTLFTFNVISGRDLLTHDQIGSSTSPYAQFATSTCDILNPTGCLQNAITWAFWPPPGAFDGFAGLYALVQKKPPFGYFNLTKNDLGNITSTASSTYSLGTVSGITTYIFGPFDAALAGIWWAIFAFWFFFHRLRHVGI